jgi:asparagine synthetase B (glutamine-hydrolysing)
MRGLVAVISHDRTSHVDEAEIRDLTEAFESLCGRGKRYPANAGDYARLIRINTTDDSQIETDGRSWVASFGLVHHEGSLLRQPIESLDGQFALVSFDASTNEVLVAGDPLGLQALYIAERDGKTYVSTSALGLAKHLRAKPSRFGVEVFLRAGYHFGSLTNWEGIERLAPGTSILYTEHGHQRCTYWRAKIDETVNKLGFKAAADHLIDVATAAFRTYFDSNKCYCTNLTGKYDSRLLNLLLRRAEIRFRTNTRGDDRHPDVRIATQVAKETGWEWLHI